MLNQYNDNAFSVMPRLLRQTRPIDVLIGHVDRRLRNVRPVAATLRPSPADGLPEAPLTDAERRQVGALMRVNHAGEVCAQALYRGQAATALQLKQREYLLVAAREETDHLAWCESRLRQLRDRTSYLNPLWYLGSFAIGSVAGLAGDRWSLGFVAETERQVEQHLEGHRRQLPAVDQRSRAIVEQMQLDEARHGRRALEAGGAELPAPARLIMRLAARVMTSSAYWV